MQNKAKEVQDQSQSQSQYQVTVERVLGYRVCLWVKARVQARVKPSDDLDELDALDELDEFDEFDEDLVVNSYMSVLKLKLNNPSTIRSTRKPRPNVFLSFFLSCLASYRIRDLET